MDANLLIEQLGGSKFLAMTGTHGFVKDGETLRMSLTKNRSKANRLYITLTPDDTYTMHFFRYTAPRLNMKTATFTDEKITEIKTIERVYSDSLQEVFTATTGLLTHL